MSTLSSVVSHLVRASMGSSVSNTVTDEELDRHVAELILKDAKKKAERYGQHGVRAFLANGMSDTNAPRANKRFLSSIIRSTDDHNKTILRAQALAAEEIKRERAEQERRERRARAEEAVEAERCRRFGRGLGRRRTDDDEYWDRWDGRTAGRKKRLRAWETSDDEDEDNNTDREKDRRKRRRRSRSRSGDHRTDRDGHSRYSSTRSDGHSDSKKRKYERWSRSRSPTAHRSSNRRTSRRRSHDKSTSRHRLRSPMDDECNDSRMYDYRRSKRHRSRECHRSSRSRRHSISASRSRSPSVSPSEGSNTRKRKRTRSPKYALDDMHSESSCSRQPSPLRSFSISGITTEEREVELRRKIKAARGIDEHTSKPSKQSRSPSDAPSPSHDIDSRTTNGQVESSSSLALKSRSVSPAVSMSMSMSGTPTPGPEPAKQLPSKMDKYFEDSYDPRLDVAPLSVPQVPATGLINNADFEGWDAMLELLRVRREDKEERKRMERLGLTKEKIKDKTKCVSEAIGIMDIEYKKRGSVREWDLGKEGF